MLQLKPAHMKKIFLFFVLICFIKISFSQNVLPKIINDTLYTSSGYKITVGQEIKLGPGTKDNGDFRYITASRSVFSMPNTRQPSLRRTAAGHTAIVKRLKAEGNSRIGHVYYIIFGIGEPVNYECDIEDAISAGEIVVPDKYKIRSNAAQPASIADELAKLKKLYDDSVITKQEFEAQKKKLLDGN